MSNFDDRVLAGRLGEVVGRLREIGTMQISETAKDRLLLSLHRLMLEYARKHPGYRGRCYVQIAGNWVVGIKGTVLNIADVDEEAVLTRAEINQILSVSGDMGVNELDDYAWLFGEKDEGGSGV